jgi:outer membrane protein insertion porin family/translocation and assembly module TamA
VLALATTACAHPYAPHPCDRPDLTGCVIESVRITGNRHIPESTLTEKIATAQSSHTLGGALESLPILGLWDRLTVDYETLDPFVLERDLARIERVYKAHGYYDAHARAARVVKLKNDRVRVEIAVQEGEPVRIASVAPAWQGAAPPDNIVALATSILRDQKRNSPFDEDSFEATKKRLRRALTDAGYAYADVQAHADVDPVERQAHLKYSIDIGPLCTFGPITIEGYNNLPVDKLRQAVHIREGQRYSTDRIDSAAAALGDLRVLGSVEATPELSKEEPRATAIPVVFHVTPTDLRTVNMGIGAEVGSRVEWHGVAGWEHRNFLGGLRRFTIEGRPGFVINPLTFATLFSKPVTPLQLLFVARLRAELEQPGFVEARTRGLINLTAQVYQLQPLDTLGYFELAGKTGVARDFWGRRVNTGLYFNMAFDQPVQLNNYAPIDVARGYHRLVVPYVQATGVLDLRYGFDGKRDPINPHSGFYLSNDTQIAFLDSQDIRFRPEMRGYIPLGKRTTLALRVTAGILYAFGGALAQAPNPECPFGIDPGIRCARQLPAGVTQDKAVDRARYIQVLQLRGFNSGGPTSNRGYAYNGIGPQEFIPLISQVGANGKLLPIATGGSALWEASAEIRFPLYDKIGATVFLDGSDVRWRWADLTAPFAPHLSTGLGLRYLTPVGPFRADFGVRIPYLQVLGKDKCEAYDPNATTPTSGLLGCYLAPQYGQAGPVFQLPLAVSFAIGEAF